MIALALLPPWSGMHPLIVHTPVALGVLAPLFVVPAVVRPGSRGWAKATLTLLVIAAVGGWLAYYSGEAAEQHFQTVGFPTPEAEAATTDHHDIGGLARFALTASAAAFAGWMLTVKKLSTPKSRLVAGFAAVLTLAATWLVVWAGHQGGELVHAHGLLAPR